jgi:hypothetical protein
VEDVSFAIMSKESASHLLFKYRFTIWVWNKVKDWLGLHDVEPSSWHTMRSVKDWWIDAIRKQGKFKKAMGRLRCWFLGNFGMKGMHIYILKQRLHLQYDRHQNQGRACLMELSGGEGRE